MKTAFTKLLTLLLLSAALYTSCKKDKGDDTETPATTTPPPATPPTTPPTDTPTTSANDTLAITKDNLVGTYIVASIKYKINGITTDMTNQIMLPCEKDDLLIFKADLTFEYKDAGTVCSPSGDNKSTWSTDGKTVTIYGTKNTVKVLTRTTLVFEDLMTESGISYTATTTLTRQ
jgi:hypothetical protein